MKRWNRLAIVVVILFVVMLIGTLGYWLIEHVSLLNALYMTVITISTVGFSEVIPLSVAGKVFTIFLIIIGVATVLNIVGTFLNVSLEEFLKNRFGRRRMEKRINRIKNHFIIAGYGRVGQNVVSELIKADKDFVVIESDADKISDLEEQGSVYVEGDATDDSIIEKAGIGKAQGLIAALGNDADNVFIVLTAKRARPDIFIVARANTTEAIEKLKTAGASRVVSPPIIGGKRIATMLLRPAVSDVLDLVSHGEKLKYRLEEIEIGKSSQIANKTISDSNIRGKTGSMILAVKRGEDFNTNPDINTVLKGGDLLIVIGTQAQLETLEEMA